VNEEHATGTVRRTRRVLGVIAVTVCVFTSPTSLRAAELTAAATCRAEATRRFGTLPVIPARRDGVLAPRKLHHVWPRYPALPPNTRVFGQACLAYVLIAPSGAVDDVWIEREPRFEPAFPAFMAAGVHAVREWRFAPTIIDEQPRPVCLAVSFTIDLA